MKYWDSGMVRLCMPRGELVERRREGAMAAWCYGWVYGYLRGGLLLGVVTVRRGFWYAVFAEGLSRRRRLREDTGPQGEFGWGLCIV